MFETNSQAEELNQKIKTSSQTTYNLLSDRGKSIFFPKKGILAQTAEARGKRINATIGIALEEDKSPMVLPSISRHTDLDPKVFTYASSYGIDALRKKWKEFILAKNPSLNAETSLPIVTSGITHALSIIGYLFVNPVDKIITPDKFWGNYRLIFENTFGAKLETFNTFKGGFDVDSMGGKLSGKGKKILLLNFPNNPTGYTPTNKEAEKILDTIKKCAENGSEILVICDDAYFGLVYKNGVYKESLFSRLANLNDNVLAVKVDGVTKEDYVWGLRIGFITYGSKTMSSEAYSCLEAKTAGVVRATISNSSHLSQSLVLAGFESPDYEKEKSGKFSILESRFRKVEKVLEDKRFSEFFSPLPFNSGYFMCVELKGLDAEKVRKILLEKYNTGVIATGSLLRIAFSSVPESRIKELFENIYNACKETFKLSFQ